MIAYETPEMPDTCYCSSNGECSHCLALLEASDVFSVYDRHGAGLFTGTLDECREFHAQGEASMRVHLWVK